MRSDGAEAPSELKHDDLEAEVDTLPAEEVLQVDITPKDFTTQATVKEEPEDVLNKSIKTMEAKMASVSVEAPKELVAVGPEPEAKPETLMGFSLEASTKIEFSIPESPTDPVLIPAKPLTMEDQSVTEAPPQYGAEATIENVEPLAIENDAVSGQEVSETIKLLACETEDEALSPAEPLN